MQTRSARSYHLVVEQPVLYAQQVLPALFQEDDKFRALTHPSAAKIIVYLWIQLVIDLDLLDLLNGFLCKVL